MGSPPFFLAGREKATGSSMETKVYFEIDEVTSEMVDNNRVKKESS